MSDLAGFVAARLWDVEQRARQCEDVPWLLLMDECRPALAAAKALPHFSAQSPKAVLREVAAKRAILEAWQRAEAAVPSSGWESDRTQALEDVVRMLAAVYSDHPDYDPAWAL